jgi:hypothetical protein
MGMHFGFVVARVGWPAFHAALEARCGTFREAEELSPDQWFDFPRGEDVLHVASVGGATYVLDPGLVLSMDADFVATVAEELSCLVVGAGGETVSGSFWLTAADGKDLRRAYFHVLATLTEPFSMGDPLPSEASVDWTDIDGEGILARLGDLGLSAEVFKEGPTAMARRVRWEDVKLPSPGPLRAQINEHIDQHERAGADDWLQNITVKDRGGGGFDLTAWPPPKPRGPRLRGLFKRGT